MRLHEALADAPAPKHRVRRESWVAHRRWVERVSYSVTASDGQRVHLGAWLTWSDSIALTRDHWFPTPDDLEAQDWVTEAQWERPVPKQRRESDE